jgi:hypothetical protein
MNPMQIESLAYERQRELRAEADRERLLRSLPHGPTVADRLIQVFKRTVSFLRRDRRVVRAEEAAQVVRSTP